jgi:glycosyltransferase involved in cell wall biosynthesis
MLSVVIPVHNEEPSILPLYDRLTRTLEVLNRPYEIIFVDDASTDRSFDLLANLVETDARLKVIRLRRNFGQTAALSAGFHEAQGDVIVSMDGDLQHAPEDLPALLAKIDEGYDIASGWRRDRVDRPLARRLPSRIAEVPIRNTLRQAGGSHYGLSRTLRVLFDLLTIKFLLSYLTRPMHFFGKLGLAGTSLGGPILGYLAFRKFTGHEILFEHGPLLLAGSLLLLAGIIMFTTGLLGEVLMRIYAIREIRTRGEARPAERAP